MIERARQPSLPPCGMLLVVGLASIACSTNGREAPIVTPSVTVVLVATTAPAGSLGADGGDARDAGTAPQPGRATREIKFEDGAARISAIASNDQGDVFVAGSFAGSFAAGSFHFTDRTSAEHGFVDNLAAFVLRLDSNGVPAWGAQLGADPAALWHENSVTSLAVGPRGELAMAGTMSGTRPGSTDVDAGGFVAEYGPDGARRWATPLPGAIGPKVTFDPEGNVVVWDAFQFAVRVGRWSFRAPGYSKARFEKRSKERGERAATSEIPPSSFVAKLDASGTPVWAHQLSGDQVVEHVAVDARGNLFVAGTYGKATKFGATKLENAAARLSLANDFVGAMDAGGKELWAHRLGGVGSLDVHGWTVDVGGMAVDAHGDVFVAGEFAIEPSTAEGPLSYLAKLDPKGSLVWSKQPAKGSRLFARRVAVDREGNVILSGESRDPSLAPYALGADLGPVDATYGEPNFVAKLTSAGAGVWAQRVGGYVIHEEGVERSVECAVLTVLKSGEPIVAGDFREGALHQGIFAAWLVP
jgi:hypothetical protein